MSSIFFRDLCNNCTVEKNCVDSDCQKLYYLAYCFDWTLTRNDFWENHGIGCSHEKIQQTQNSRFHLPGIPLDSGIPYLEFHWTPHSGPGIPPDSGILGSTYPEFHWTPHFGPGIPPDSGIPGSTYPEFHRIPPGILSGPGILLEFHRNSGLFFTRVL